MKQILLGLVFLVTAGVAFSDVAQASDAPLDISNITAVAITGEASSVDIRTAPDEAYRATIQRHRSGWFANWNSGWAYDDCSAASRMWVEGSLLHIDIGIRTWFSVSDCSYDINLNVRKQTAIAIRQQALKATMSGDFSAVAIAAKAADVTLSGHADTISLQSEALRVGLTLTTSAENEAVTIDSRMLEADLDFAAAPLLAYTVNAKAAFVDSTRKSTPGARPSLTIAGDFVHATIR